MTRVEKKFLKKVRKVMSNESGRKVSLRSAMRQLKQYKEGIKKVCG